MISYISQRFDVLVQSNTISGQVLVVAVLEYLEQLIPSVST